MLVLNHPAVSAVPQNTQCWRTHTAALSAMAMAAISESRIPMFRANLGYAPLVMYRKSMVLLKMGRALNQRKKCGVISIGTMLEQVLDTMSMTKMMGMRSGGRIVIQKNSHWEQARRAAWNAPRIAKNLPAVKNSARW